MVYLGIQPFVPIRPILKLNATGIESNREKKRPNRKLTKADISQPTNFKHLAHVGWNDGKRLVGLELNSDDVSNLDEFLEKAGVSEQQLNDRETRAYIYDFIQIHNVLDSVKSEKEQQEPPPVPTRNVNIDLFMTFQNQFGLFSLQNATQRMAPPPPPSNIGISKPPAQLPTSNLPKRGPPGIPPPISDPQIQVRTNAILLQSFLQNSNRIF